MNFQCPCCIPAKQYSSSKALYKHQRKYDPNYVDSRIAADLERRANYAKENRKCIACYDAIPFEDRATKLKFCSQSCAGAFNGKLFPKRGRLPLVYLEIDGEGRNILKSKICLADGCEFPIKKGAQKYCSHVCERKHKWETSTSEGTERLSAPKAKKYLLDELGAVCQQCKLSEWNSKPIPLELEHIDGNHENNSRKNLTLLCRNCHGQTPTFGNRNKGNGRAWRRVFYARQKAALALLERGEEPDVAASSAIAQTR
jgi:hypothetical protein